MKKTWKMLATLVSVLSIMVLSAASVFANGNVDWEKSVITVTGTGIYPPNAVNAAQARYRAKRAAINDGYRLLLEATKGVNVTAESTVENFMLTNDAITTRVQGVVNNVQIISERDSGDGGYEVTMQMPLFGASGSLASAVLARPAQKESFPEPVQSVAPSVPSYDASTSVSVRIDVASSTPTVEAPNNHPIGGYTGLIVDCRGLGLKPVMSPVIKNANGQPIYGHKNLNVDFIIANGMASYTSDINNGTARAGSNPLVIKAVALDDHNGNPVLSVADANRVLIENQTSGFLEKASVVFIR